MGRSPPERPRIPVGSSDPTTRLVYNRPPCRRRSPSSPPTVKSARRPPTRLALFGDPDEVTFRPPIKSEGLSDLITGQTRWDRCSSRERVALTIGGSCKPLRRELDAFSALVWYAIANDPFRWVRCQGRDISLSFSSWVRCTGGWHPPVCRTFVGAMCTGKKYGERI